MHVDVREFAVQAHQGAVDTDGCHYNANKMYHCHYGVKGGNLHPGYQKQKSDRTFKSIINQQKKKEIERDALFEQADWGEWTDADRDCQDTRNEVLAYFSRKPVTFTNKKKCIVKKGSWLDQFTGRMYSNASDLVIAPLITLKQANQAGGVTWTEAQKNDFKNDMLNLIPVHSESARLKGDLKPIEWMPPNVDFHCPYLFQWQRIKGKYGLQFPQDDDIFIKYRLKQCEQSKIKRG